MSWRSPKPIGCTGTPAAHSPFPAAHSPLPAASPAPTMAGCSVVCAAACWAVCSSRISFWSQYEIRKKFCAFTVILVTSTLAQKLLCLHWKSYCHIVHQLIGRGLKIHDSKGHRNFGIDDFVGCSFSSKSVINCNSFSIPTDNNFNVSLETNTLPLCIIHRHLPWKLIQDLTVKIIAAKCHEDKNWDGSELCTLVWPSEGVRSWIPFKINRMLRFLDIS